jgi:hypothetical protein
VTRVTILTESWILAVFPPLSAQILEGVTAEEQLPWVAIRGSFPKAETPKELAWVRANQPEYKAILVYDVSRAYCALFSSPWPDLAAPHRSCNYTNVVRIFILLSSIRCSIRTPEWLLIVSFRSTL